MPARDTPTLFVLGNASIDVTLNVPRLPLAGETLMAAGIRRAPGGKGLNQAVVAARAGAAVHFCAPLGREPEAARVRSALAAEPFASLQLVDSDLPSDLSTLLVAADGENLIVSTGDCADALTPAIAAVFAAGVRPEDWLLIQGNLTEAATFAAVAQAGRIIFNTAPIRWVSPRIMAACTVVVANAGEAAMLTALSDPAAAAAALGGEIGIVTAGADGCFVAGRGGVVHHPAHKVVAVDTSGAGDSFCGVLAARLVAGWNLTAAIDHAQRAAALAVSRAGCFTGLPQATELAAFPAG